MELGVELELDNNIMITSRVLYKHSHTPPASAQPWQPGHQELDPALALSSEGKIKT